MTVSPDPHAGPADAGGTGMKGRLISSAGALTATFALSSVLQILAVPVFIGGWGTEVYAQWLAISAAAAMLSLLDVGFTPHFTSLIMAAAARGDRAGEAKALATGMTVFAGVIAAGVAVAVAAWRAGAADLLGLQTEDARLAAALSAACVLLLTPRSLAGGVFAAHGRFTAAIYIAAAHQLAGLAGALLTAAAGGGLAAAAAAQLAAAVLVGWALPLAALRRLCPGVALFALRKPTGEELRFHLRKSALHGVASGATVILLNLPVLMLQGAGLSGAAVIAFTTMRTFAGLIRQVIAQVILAATVEMTRQHHQGDASGLHRLFVLICRICGGGGGLLTGLVFMLGPPFFIVWTHGAAPFDPFMALVFIGGAVAMVPATTAAALLRQTDHAEILAGAHGAQIALSVIFCLILTAPYGGPGAAAAVTAAEALALGLPALNAAARLFGLERRRILTSAWTAAAVGAAAGWTAATAAAALLPMGRLAEIAAFGLVWGVFIAPAAFFILLPADQRNWLRRTAGSFFSKRCSAMTGDGGKLGKDV
jgi:O-antigen/teichoic acid export membrane protein